MKTINKIIILLLLAIFINPDNANAVNLAVLDIESVLKNSVVMKDIQDKISKKRTEFQTEINKKQSALEIEGKKLESKKSVLAQDAFEKEKIKFEEKISNLKYYVEEKQSSLKSASIKAIEQVNTKINDIIAQISEEKNLDLILPTTQTLFYRDEIDISSEVLKKLNQIITKIDVKFD